MKISKIFRQKKSVQNILLSVAFLILTIGGYSLYWYLLTEKIIDSIQEKKGEYITEGYNIESSSIDISGFPFWLVTTITKPMISRINKNLSWNWRGEKLIISTRPWELHQIEVSFSGSHLATIETQYRNLDIDLKTSNSKIFLKWAANSSFPTKARVELKDILYSFEPLPGLGNKTRVMDFQIEVIGVPPTSFASATLVSWRNQGGALEIQNILFEHGSLEIKGEGTLALNKKLQPLAAFSLEARGYLELIDRLNSSRLIGPNEARLAKAVLSMLAVSKKNEDNNKSRKMVKFPLTIQDGYLYVGPLSLGSIPEFHWPLLE